MWENPTSFHHAKNKKIIKTHLFSNSCSLLFPTHPSHLKRLASSTFRQEKGGETSFVRYGEKTPGNRFGNLFLAPQKKCHFDAIVSRFSSKKTKRFYLLWKVKYFGQFSCRLCLFVWKKPSFANPQHTLRLQMGVFQKRVLLRMRGWFG